MSILEEAIVNAGCLPCPLFLRLLLFFPLPLLCSYVAALFFLRGPTFMENNRRALDRISIILFEGGSLEMGRNIGWGFLQG